MAAMTETVGPFTTTEAIELTADEIEVISLVLENKRGIPGDAMAVAVSEAVTWHRKKRDRQYTGYVTPWGVEHKMYVGGHLVDADGHHPVDYR